VLIALVWAGYHYGGRWLDNRREAEEKRLALVTARTWLATARFRENPDRFLAYRDSLLDEAGVTREEISEYLKRYGGREEKYLPFAHKVQYYVDSLARIEDSLIREAKIGTADAPHNADTAM